MGKRFENSAAFRFYEELNDFLPESQRKSTIAYFYNGHPAIKDPIEALGVPHTEVDLIIANGHSVGFSYQLQDRDRIAVYPVFESFDISPIVKLREKPLRRSAFVLDVQLGKLSRLMRMLGFDVLYRNDYDDPEVVRISLDQGRIILTRDRRLLYAKVITHGYWIRAVTAFEQIEEVLKRFDLYSQIHPFHRCLLCNTVLELVEKEEILDQLEPKTRRYYQKFYQCPACHRIYWEGSHLEHMRGTLAKILNSR